MRTTLIAIVLLAFGFVPQARPDFSGTWVAKDRTGILGEKFTAVQNAKTLELVISVAVLPQPVRVVYNLDGSESRNLNPRGPGVPDEPIFSKLSWDGTRLVINTRGTVLVDGKPIESKRVIWIDSEGLLNIERSSEGQPTTRSAYIKINKP